MTDIASAPDALADTATWTAAMRAQETARPDRLFDDPWAHELAGPEGLAWLASRREESLLPMVIRTRYFDDRLQEVAASGVRQVVLLGAGLDTRAYRLAWPPGTILFELDTPGVLSRKATIMERAGATARCARRTTNVDLAGAWTGALATAGFDDARPAAFLLEGLLFYLPNDLVAGILRAIAAIAAPEGWLGFDIVNAATLSSPYTRPWIEMQAQAGAPWLGTMEDPIACLGDRWAAGMTQPGQPDAHYGRWSLPVLPTIMPDIPHHWLVTARRTS
jgi:methyltransferase (TIGR00027 family)